MEYAQPAHSAQRARINTGEIPLVGMPCRVALFSDLGSATIVPFPGYPDSGLFGERGWQGTAAYAGGTRLWGLMPHPWRRK